MLRELHHVNVWALLVAGFGMFMLGGFWYTALFGERRKQLCGYDDAKVRQMQAARPPAVFFPAMLGCYLLLSAAMALLFAHFDIDTAHKGILAGLLLWIGPAAAIGMTSHLAADKPIGVYFIDVSYQALCLLGGGAILGAWHR